MKTAPIVAAGIEDLPPDPQALARSQQVFLRGSGLPDRWRGRERFTVLDLGFGGGHNALATWAAWRDDPRRPRRLHVVAPTPRPPTGEALARCHAGSPLAALAARCQADWPPAVHGLHRLRLEDGAVDLQLAFGETEAWLRQLVLMADAVFLDGGSPAHGTPAPRHRLQALARLSAVDATLVADDDAPALRDGLAAAGFVVTSMSGVGGRGATAARHAPVFRAAPPPGRPPAALGREAVVVGAGLAGASVASALAGQGWHCRVLDRHPQPAAETSGNAGGLFHPVVHADDGPHARLHRAGALWMRQALRSAQAAGLPDDAGAADGLLRLDARRRPDDLQALADRLGLPPDLARVLTRQQASDLAGVPLPGDAWWFGPAGWVDPAAWVRHRLASPGVLFRGGQAVQALQRRGADGGWRLLDADGRELDRAPVVVLACAAGLPRLLPPLAPLLRAVRGQISALPATARLPRPSLPLAGAGYVLPLPDGRLLCGATTQPGDEDSALREADHHHNLAQLRRLTGWDGALPDPATLDGRVGWRQVAPDRLPLAGPVPLAWSATAELPEGRFDPPRLVPRQPGLWLLGGLASRGLTTAALLGEALSAALSGAPVPLPADLLDAVDPARFIARDTRRAG
jgi:tRNA 5-methylaminomethyl-2-thiouridine biosynthesis bifunctional protein